MSAGKLIRIEGPLPEGNDHYAYRLAEELRLAGRVDVEAVNVRYATPASQAINALLGHAGQNIAPKRRVELWAMGLAETYERVTKPKLDEGTSVIEAPSITAMSRRAVQDGLALGDVPAIVRHHVGTEYISPDATFCLYRDGRQTGGAEELTDDENAAIQAAELSLRGLVQHVCANSPEAALQTMSARAERLLVVRSS